ncbi:hypothetical protein B0J13DRAFT_681247 [Dactylonectria estremocensis]|uniref:Chromo domain-containing protein n=1 Tax=Dactylonectria estremocensis TaxID=1079267 RepID=A0A9P9IDC3_9HYPO|nr:hypothetical protein B0J13DRAFT_681247 [Dactylonectria estremocensis]
MNSSLSAMELPPTGPAASPLKTKKIHGGSSTPFGSRDIPPARLGSVGRDIIRDVDIDQNDKRAVNATALATGLEPEDTEPEDTEPKVTEPISPPKEDSIDPQTLQKQSEPHSTAECQEDVLAKPSAPRDILADLGKVEIESFKTHRVDEANATVNFLVKWANGKETWEPEWNLQQQVPMLIYKYWDSVDGRDTATCIDVYHVFRVQWVGYRRTEPTWEYESKLVQIAPKELIKFRAKNFAPDW